MRKRERDVLVEEFRDQLKAVAEGIQILDRRLNHIEERLERR